MDVQGVWAVVPVKAFDLAKQRLSGLLTPVKRRELARAMLEDVLDNLACVKGLTGTAIVTSDSGAASVARAHQVDVISETPGCGLTAAVMGAAAQLARKGCATMLALPGDVPGASPCELERLLAEHRVAPGFSLVPSADGRGTNAVVITPPDAVRLAYGQDSCPRHLRAARDAGIEPNVLRFPGIALDLDLPQDLATFLQRTSPTRTWRQLAHWQALAARTRS